MKLTYKAQMFISLVIILLANVISTIMKHWIYRSGGFVICGLLWLIHPETTFVKGKVCMFTKS